MPDRTLPKSEEKCKSLNYAPIFEWFGVHFVVNGNPNQLRAHECPFCGEGPFHMATATGLYECKRGSCGAKGNVITFLTAMHLHHLNKTTAKQRSELGQRRGINPRTIERHQLAYDQVMDRWLLPFKNGQGNVVNFQSYDWNKPNPNKRNLPILETSLYNFPDLVTADTSKRVYLCEGVFDALALDYAIGHKSRYRYVIVATPGGFKQVWAEHFRNRKVTALYDNDKGGAQHNRTVEKCLMGDGRVADELRLLKWPDGMEGFDVNDFVRKYPNINIVSWIDQHNAMVQPESKLAWSFGWEGCNEPHEVDWIWANRICTETYISFSGKGGTFKSTLMRDLVARYTQGCAMPKEDAPSMPAGYVIWVYIEETEASIRAKLKAANADMDRMIFLPAKLKDGEHMNLLTQLDGIREMIRRYSVRLVVIDGQNSVIGSDCIATDMLARNNITNKLHTFAQEERIALIGLRNEDEKKRALGPQSMCDIGRCILRTEPDMRVGGELDTNYFWLWFPKVSDAPQSLYRPVPYAVADHPGHAPVILWGKYIPYDQTKPEDIEKAAEGEAKTAADNQPDGKVKRGRKGKKAESKDDIRAVLAEALAGIVVDDCAACEAKTAAQNRRTTCNSDTPGETPP
jgi:hypothetical protein